MMNCLVCRLKLSEAFQHLLDQFLVCRACFQIFVCSYQFNGFRRISVLKKEITPRMMRWQKKLAEFIDSQKVDPTLIYLNKVVEVYQMWRQSEKNNLKNQEQLTQDSTEVQLPNEKTVSYGLYDNYNWLKQKIQSNIAHIKQRQIVSQFATHIKPRINQLGDKKNRIYKSYQYLKKQIMHLQKESPSMSIASGEFKKILSQGVKNILPTKFL